MEWKGMEVIASAVPQVECKMATDDKPSSILKYIYLGDKNHAKDKEGLKKLNITHILNCTPSREVDRAAGVPNYFEKECSFTYKRIGIFDNKGEDVTPHLESAVNFMEHAKHHGNVLVHCIRGVSRSASFVIAYLMKKNEMTLDEALSHVQSRRPVVMPNDSFLSQLRKYEIFLDAKRDEKLKLEAKFNSTAAVGKSTEIGAAAGPCFPSDVMRCSTVEQEVCVSSVMCAPSVPTHDVPGLVIFPESDNSGACKEGIGDVISYSELDVRGSISHESPDDRTSTSQSEKRAQVDEPQSKRSRLE